MPAYKPAKQRDWRQVELPDHRELEQTQQALIIGLQRVSQESPYPAETGLSALVKAAVHYAYQQWIVKQVEYTDEVHEKGIQLYALVTHTNFEQKKKAVYLQAGTLEQIDALGDFLGVTKRDLPQLNSPRHKSVYNRKLIIILCLNALSEALKSGVVK